MAGYAKFWTAMLTDEWFVSLNCQQRGLWMQLILLAKAWGDTGVVTFRSCSAAAQQVGIDRSTLANSLLKFQHDSRIEVVQDVGKFLNVTLVNYEKWQRVRLQKGANFPQPKGQTPVEISHTSKAKQSKAYQSKGTPHKAGVEFWVSEYREKIGRDYVFQKKDGVAISRILKQVNLSEFQRLSTWLLTTTERWYCDNRTPAILASKINEIRGLIDKPVSLPRQPGFETAAKEDAYFARKRGEEEREARRILGDD